jgi:selenium-dependent xanthine dehydrogenase
MIRFYLNGKETFYKGDHARTLLDYLRNDRGLTSVKDGCSGQAACGACTVEIDGKPRLSCVVNMVNVAGSEVLTLDGIPEPARSVIGRTFARKGAVQCGFCTPGMIMRARTLFYALTEPSRGEIIRAINPNLCRCTGYVKIIDAIEETFRQLISPEPAKDDTHDARIGKSYPKYRAVDLALGRHPFVDDIRLPKMLHGALLFSMHPRAKVLKIETGKAGKQEGVVRVFTAADIPGNKYSGLIHADWPLMVAEGEITACVGDVLAGVVATTEKAAREAIRMIETEYKVLEPVTDVETAIDPNSAQVHPGADNVLEKCIVRRGDTEEAFLKAAWTCEDTFTTQRVEHGFLETECAVAAREGAGIRLYSQGQGIYVDRRQIAGLLRMKEESITVEQVHTGGGFGGKEDMTVQDFAALFCHELIQPVKVRLSREESIRMHPKRHPVIMHVRLACDREGKFTGLRLRAYGDTGAYASVGTKVMERIAGHATGAYHIPNVDVEAWTVYTNNPPSGAMRGFGVPQVTFAVESCIDEICRMGGFDRWQIRYDNALDTGLRTATGQVLGKGVGLKKTLLAVRDQFCSAKYAGIACGIKNTGVGNGMTDESRVRIEIVSPGKVVIRHGWSEMGQGIHTMAIQTLHEETGIDPSIMEASVETGAGLVTGMTTSSRATVLLCNAILDAVKELKKDLQATGLEGLAGRVYEGSYVCNWTTKPGNEESSPVTHFAYGYATQVVILDDTGNIRKVVAAHDAGRIMNRTLFEGQIEGAVHMGLGYALTEDLPVKKGVPVSLKLKDCGILRAREMPPVEVIGIEEPDPVGPYGARGIGEIGMVPTAAAVANAFACFYGDRKTNLPLGTEKPARTVDP